MPLFSSKELQKVRILEKGAAIQAEGREFDIFLSHSYDDKSYVEEMKQILEDEGYSVYVDWIFDRQLDRSNVTLEAADLLRRRMKQSKCLVYLISANSSDSKWMQWELGFFDGAKEKVAILPISETVDVVYTYDGLEYLGLYPYMFYDGKINNLRIKVRTGSALAFNDWLHNGDQLGKSISEIMKRLR